MSRSVVRMFELGAAPDSKLSEMTLQDFEKMSPEKVSVEDLPLFISWEELTKDFWGLLKQG